MKSTIVLVAALLLATPASAGDYPLQEHLDLFRPRFDARAQHKLLDGNTPTAGILGDPEKRFEQHRRSMRALHQWRPDAARQMLLDERCRATRPRCLEL